MDKETYKTWHSVILLLLILFGFILLPYVLFNFRFPFIEFFPVELQQYVSLSIFLLPVLFLVLLKLLEFFKPKPKTRSPNKKIYYPGDPCPECGSRGVVIMDGEAACMDCGNKRKVRERDRKEYDLPCPYCHKKDKCFLEDDYACANCGKNLHNPF
ncbi:hypothetical protein K8R43_02260 [archaeon]|nr:hypothetical protein [archaeon]